MDIFHTDRARFAQRADRKSDGINIEMPMF